MFIWFLRSSYDKYIRCKNYMNPASLCIVLSNIHDSRGFGVGGTMDGCGGHQLAMVQYQIKLNFWAFEWS